jgi:hypothetical protein
VLGEELPAGVAGFGRAPGVRLQLVERRLQERAAVRLLVADHAGLRPLEPLLVRVDHEDQQRARERERGDRQPRARAADDRHERGCDQRESRRERQQPKRRKLERDRDLAGVVEAALVVARADERLDTELERRQEAGDRGGERRDADGCPRPPHDP